MEHPAALPRLIVALRLAFGIALVVAVTVKVAADPRGLGNAIMVAQQALQPALCSPTSSESGAALGRAQCRSDGRAGSHARPRRAPSALTQSGDSQRV